MSLAIPARVLRKLTARWFPVRGQATICLTDAEFQRRWSGLVADIGVHGYSEVAALSGVRGKIEARWVRIWDEPEEAKRSQWTVGRKPRMRPEPVGRGLPAGIIEKPYNRGKKGADGCARCGRLLGRTTRHLCVRCTLADEASANMGSAGFNASKPTKRSQDVSQ